MFGLSDEKTNVAMAKVHKELHDTDFVKEVGTQMKAVLAGCKGDRERENVANAFGAIFRVEHKIVE